MGAAALRALFLLLSARFSWAQTRVGSHSLRFFFTAISRPGLGKPRFIVVGYVDDTEIVSFDSDSDAENTRMEPRAPWMEQEGPDYWEEQTSVVRTQAQQFERNLMTLVRFYNKSQDDSHTLQWLQGCDVGTGGHPLRWYNQLAYDGVDCLILNEDLSSWTAETSTVTQNSQHKSEAYLKDKCSELLQKYLEKGKDRLLRSGAQGSQTLFMVPLGCLLEVWRAEGVWVGREDLKQYSSQVECYQASTSSGLDP